MRGAVLGSVRAIRELAQRGRGAAGPDAAAIDAGPPLTLSRTTLDGRHRVALRLAPRGGAAVHAGGGGPITLRAAPGEPLRVELSVLADDPPLTPIPRGELLAEGVVADDHALSALAFLAYEEKLLAGSWRFLTYFGRDGPCRWRCGCSCRRCGPGWWRPGSARCSTGSAPTATSPTRRPSGSGPPSSTWPAGGARRTSASRSSTDPWWTTTSSSPPSPPRTCSTAPGGRARAIRRLLSRRTPSGDSCRGALARNLALVLRRAEPFAATLDACALVALQEGRASGDWRDSEEGLGGGRIPFNVNAALVPAALDAAARLFASGPPR